MVTVDELVGIVRAPDGGPPLGSNGWRRVYHECGAMVSVQMANKRTIGQVEPARCECGRHIWTHSVADGTVTARPGRKVA